MWGKTGGDVLLYQPLKAPHHDRCMMGMKSLSDVTWGLIGTGMTKAYLKQGGILSWLREAMKMCGWTQVIGSAPAYNCCRAVRDK